MLWSWWVTGRAYGLSKAKAGCWFVGGDDSTGALHVLYFQLSPPTQSSLASVKSRMQTFWYWLTQYHQGKWLLKWTERHREKIIIKINCKLQFMYLFDVTGKECSLYTNKFSAIQKMFVQPVWCKQKTSCLYQILTTCSSAFESGWKVMNKCNYYQQ